MTERATIIPPSTVRFERLLPGPLERVWAYLTESDKRATWLAAGEFDLRVGGRIELHFHNASLSDDVPPPDAGKHSFEGKITRLEPMRVLAHTWIWNGQDSEVLYELAPAGTDGKQVLLTIHHRLPDELNTKLAVSGGWVVHTGILQDVLKGVKPRPFYTTHRLLVKEHESIV